MTKEEKAKVNLKRIHALRAAESIARSYGTKLDAILGTTRFKTVVRARHHLWTLVRDSLDMSWPEIASVFNVDHTTIIYGVRTHNERRDALSSVVR